MTKIISIGLDDKMSFAIRIVNSKQWWCYLNSYYYVAKKKNYFQWIQSGDSIDAQSSYKWSVFIRLESKSGLKQEKKKQYIQLQKDIYTEVERNCVPAK